MTNIQHNPGEIFRAKDGSLHVYRKTIRGGYITTLCETCSVNSICTHFSEFSGNVEFSGCGMFGHYELVEDE